MWKNVSRNFDQLQELKSKHFEIVDFKHSAYSGYRHRELTKEINEWRECIRKSEFLNKKELSSMDGKQLDEQLIDFTKLSKIKRYYTITKNFLNKEIPKDDQLLHPVYLTPQERVEHKDIRRRKKETLRTYINDFISCISCKNTKEYFQSLNNNLRDTHVALDEFFLELKEFVTDQNK